MTFDGGKSLQPRRLDGRGLGAVTVRWFESFEGRRQIEGEAPILEGERPFHSPTIHPVERFHDATEPEVPAPGSRQPSRVEAEEQSRIERVGDAEAAGIAMNSAEEVRT